MVTFKCADPGPWREALASYPARVREVGGEKLAALDDFVRLDLPKAIEQRRRTSRESSITGPVKAVEERRRSSGEGSEGGGAFITKGELEKVVSWKLSRGKWRPRLQSMAAALEEDAVQEASRKAFEALPDLAQAVKELTVLKGVGPATASAVLTVHSPDVAPFMSDEALLAAVGGSKEYTAKKYLEYAAKMQEKAEELKAASMGQEESSDPKSSVLSEANIQDCSILNVANMDLNVANLERAIWASAAETAARQKRRAQEGQGQSKGGKKRQRK